MSRLPRFWKSFEQMKIEPIQKVCIIGDGKLGLLSAMVFREKHEGEILLIGHHDCKLSRIKDLVDVKKEEELSGTTHKSWDVVIEATGSSKGLLLAMQLVKPRGTIVLKSTMAHAEALDLTPIVIDEVTLMGSRCGRFFTGNFFTHKTEDTPRPFNRWDLPFRTSQ